MEYAKIKDSNGKKLSRKQREYLVRRQSILEAALKLFSAKGYSGASMHQIAGASEFSIGTLYNFFETKETLYLTIIEEKFLEARQRIENELTEDDECTEKIRQAVRALLTFMEENRDFFNIFLGLRTVPEPAVHGGIHEKVIQHYQEYLSFFQQLMEEGIREGAFRDFSSTELALSLIGNVNAAIHEWLIGPGEDSLLARTDRILDLFFHGAMHHPDSK